MKFNTFNEQEKEMYRLLMGAMFGVYAEFTAPGKSVNPNSIKQFKEAITTKAEEFLNGMFGRFEIYKSEMSVKGHNKFDDDAKRDLARILYSNVATFVQAFRSSSGNFASMLKDSGHGAIGELIKMKIQSPKFETYDSAGRKWASEKLYATTMRNYLYFTEITATIDDISKTTDLIKVVYDDPEHKNNGLILSITGNTTGYPSYQSEANKIFHFNSSAGVEGVYPE